MTRWEHEYHKVKRVLRLFKGLRLLYQDDSSDLFQHICESEPNAAQHLFTKAHKRKLKGLEKLLRSYQVVSKRSQSSKVAMLGLMLHWVSTLQTACVRKEGEPTVCADLKGALLAEVYAFVVRVIELNHVT
jgi:hypothetical protein